jgi:hypothetical protein
MVLYTPLAPEDVLGIGRAASDVSDVRLAAVGGRPCLVRTGPDGCARIERLMSTDPADFLDPRFQPGRPVPYHLEG